jgi:hypothetical protein
MAATVIKRIGYGQVEPNHLSMQRTGQIHAQLPAAKAISQLENGQFAKYDIASGEVNFTGAGEWYMVFNEVKLYGETYNETYKDYAMKSDNFIDHEMVPRLVKINVGDIYTTNCVGAAGAYRSEYAGIELNEGDELTPDSNGFLNKAEDADYVLTVVKVYTLADGQPAVKVMRTK